MTWMAVAKKEEGKKDAQGNRRDERSEGGERGAEGM